MKQSQNLVENIEQYLLGGDIGIVGVVEQASLNKLNVPVAVAVPNKLVNLLHRDSELEFFEVFVYLFRHVVEG